jgi:hypothetical protein
MFRLAAAFFKNLVSRPAPRQGRAQNKPRR